MAHSLDSVIYSRVNCWKRIAVITQATDETKFWKAMKRVRNGENMEEVVVKDDDGRVLTEETEVCKKCKQCLKGSLSVRGNST